MDPLLVDLLRTLPLPMVGIYLFITDRIISGAAYRKVEAESDRKTKLIEEKVIPMAAKAAELLAVSQKRIDDLEAEQRMAGATSTALAEAQRRVSDLEAERRRDAT